MGMPKYAARRDLSEKGLVECLRSLGVSVVLTGKPFDALLGFRNVTYLCDFKTPNTYYGRGLNQNQKNFVDVWHGSPPLLFKTDDDVLAWYAEVTK